MKTVGLISNNIHQVVGFLRVLGHEEHSNNLLHAYQAYISRIDNLVKGPGLSDNVVEAHSEIQKRVAEYENAYEEFLKAWEYHLDLITVKPWEEKNA
jgi:hypothetical protein